MFDNVVGDVEADAGVAPHMLVHQDAPASAFATSLLLGPQMDAGGEKRRAGR